MPTRFGFETPGERRKRETAQLRAEAEQREGERRQREYDEQREARRRSDATKSRMSQVSALIYRQHPIISEILGDYAYAQQMSDATVYFEDYRKYNISIQYTWWVGRRDRLRTLEHGVLVELHVSFKSGSTQISSVSLNVTTRRVTDTKQLADIIKSLTGIEYVSLGVMSAESNFSSEPAPEWREGQSR